MSMFLKDQWKEWAREWGLTHRPEKGWVHRTEQIVGERNRLLIRVGWGPQENPGLVTCVRFPRSADLQRVRQALVDDATLDALPGKGAGRRKAYVDDGTKKVVHLSTPEFLLSPGLLVWHRGFALRAPKPAEAQAWVDALVTAVARATPAFDGRCETCGTAYTGPYALIDDLPVRMCGSCQQRLRAEGEMAERSYDMSEARHLPGATLALFGALAGAVAWAAIGALTERIFTVAAIGIGALVAWAYRRGAGRVDIVGRLIAAGLTVFSVVLGEVLLLTWWVSKASPEVGFDPDAGWLAYRLSWKVAPGQEVITLVFALVGAWFATRVLVRPKLTAKIETAGAEQSKAA